MMNKNLNIKLKDKVKNFLIFSLLNTSTYAKDNKKICIGEMPPSYIFHANDIYGSKELTKLNESECLKNMKEFLNKNSGYEILIEDIPKIIEWLKESIKNVESLIEACENAPTSPSSTKGTLYSVKNLKENLQLMKKICAGMENLKTMTDKRQDENAVLFYINPFNGGVPFETLDEETIPRKILNFFKQCHIDKKDSGNTVKVGANYPRIGFAVFFTAGGFMVVKKVFYDNEEQSIDNNNKEIV